MQKLQIMSTPQCILYVYKTSKKKNEKVTQSTTHTGIKPGHRKCGSNVGLEWLFDFSMIKILYPNCFFC